MPPTLSKSRASLAQSGRKPYSPKLADFIKTSRELQTLYANLEGFYKRRVFPSDRKELLEHYLTAAIYFEKGIGKGGNLTEDERRKISDYAKKIIDESQKYNLGEIHMNVVWIYVFKHEGNSSTSLPVFKIFKDKTTESAVFLDSFFNIHSCWNCFIDSLDLEESLLCLPRDGAYNFQETQLQLDYFLSSGCRKINAANNQARPFCVSIRQWIKSLVDELQFLSKHKDLIIMVVLVLLKLIGTINSNQTATTVATQLFLMLFNKINEKCVSVTDINGVGRIAGNSENNQNFTENPLYGRERGSETEFDPFFNIDKSESPFIETLKAHCRRYLTA